MSTTVCISASHFGQEMALAQNADLPISCKNFSGMKPPNPHPVLGHRGRAVLFPDSRCFGSHNFQIVPVHLSTDPSDRCHVRGEQHGPQYGTPVEHRSGH